MIGRPYLAYPLLMILLSLLLAPEASGQEQAGAAVPESPRVASVEALGLAEQLVEYGVEANAPEALVAAARILLDHPLSTEEVPVERLGGEETATAPTEEEPRLDVQEILDRATEMASPESAIQDVIAELRDAPRPRGRVGGVLYGIFRVRAFGQNHHQIEFRGNEPGLVLIRGNDQTDIDCYVLDPSGQRVESDTRFADECRLSFFPRTTGTYKIKIVNLGLLPRENRYELLTN